MVNMDSIRAWFATEGGEDVTRNFNSFWANPTPGYKREMDSQLKTLQEKANAVAKAEKADAPILVTQETELVLQSYIMRFLHIASLSDDEKKNLNDTDDKKIFDLISNVGRTLHQKTLFPLPWYEGLNKQNPKSWRSATATPEDIDWYKNELSRSNSQDDVSKYSVPALFDGKVDAPGFAPEDPAAEKPKKKGKVTIESIFGSKKAEEEQGRESKETDGSLFGPKGKTESMSGPGGVPSKSVTTRDDKYSYLDPDRRKLRSTYLEGFEILGRLPKGAGALLLVREGSPFDGEKRFRYRLVPQNAVGPLPDGKEIPDLRRGRRENEMEVGDFRSKWAKQEGKFIGIAWEGDRDSHKSLVAIAHDPDETFKIDPFAPERQENFPWTLVLVEWPDKKSTWETRTFIRKISQEADKHIFQCAFEDEDLFREATGQEPLDMEDILRSQIEISQALQARYDARLALRAPTRARLGYSGRSDRLLMGPNDDTDTDTDSTFQPEKPSLKNHRRLVSKLSRKDELKLTKQSKLPRDHKEHQEDAPFKGDDALASELGKLLMKMVMNNPEVTRSFQRRITAT